jgi:misacylated tRNA(Ala) deacylase
MTELLYQVDSYLKSFQAVVIGVDAANRSIQLDRTGFYPGGGGQPYDSGVILYQDQRLPMLRGKKAADGIWHQLGGEGILPQVGSAIQAEIDWQRRYALMRTHTAMHILCGVVFRDYGAHVTGGDMEPLDGRMDFEFETMTHDLVAVIEAAVNLEVEAAREVRVKILPRDEAFQIPDLIRTKISLLPPGIEFVRTVELVGLDLQADGGTHVHNTAEVGQMRIVDYKSKGKINKRIYVRLEE